MKATVTAPASRAEKKTPGSLVLSGIAITHPDRVISETGHVTKGELAEYYSASRPSSCLISCGALSACCAVLGDRRRMLLPAQSRQRPGCGCKAF